MPLSAIHPEHGTLDLTLAGFGCGGRITWEQIHRARPRTPLTCPECEWGLCPKLSPMGLCYHAHQCAGPGYEEGPGRRAAFRAHNHRRGRLPPSGRGQMPTYFSYAHRPSPLWYHQLPYELLQYWMM